MTKRKLMLVALSLCMVAILAIGGTLAYFTDTDAATNVFTVGDVDITLDEAPVIKEDGTDKWIPDPDKTKEEDRVTQNTYTDVYPGAVLPKDPIVHNVGTNDAYVRVQVAVNANVLKYYGDTYVDAFKAFVNGTFDAVNWTIVSTIPEDDTVTFVINYNHRLAAGADTTAVFEEIKIFAGWDNDDITTLGIGKGTKGAQITILAEAIQAEGFVDADGNPDMDAAWKAYAEQEFPSNE